MSIKFSYKEHFLQHILQNCTELFPGATSVMAVYYSKQKLGLHLLSKELELKGSLIEEGKLDLTYFDDYRRQRPRYSWINQQFSPNKETDKQLNIHGEYKHHSLLIRFPNKSDGLNDVLLINFKNEDQIFRISDKKQKLSTDLKQSVASVYVRTLDVIRKQIENDANIHQVIQDHRKEVKFAEGSLKSELSQLKNDQLHLIRSIVEKESKQYLDGEDIEIEWDSDTLHLIAENFTSLTEIEEVVKSALIIAINDNNEPSNSIKVEKAHIRSNSIKEEKTKEQAIDTSYQRTISLLDRYEIAASEVLKAKLNITGSNLGNNLNPAISAPAISDAIRKHSSKISHLLHTYPQRWSIIRSKFKPIQNKLNMSIDTEQLAS